MIESRIYDFFFQKVIFTLDTLDRFLKCILRSLDSIETHYFLSRVKIPPFTAPTTIPVHVRSKESLVLDGQVPRIASPTREGLLFIWPQGAHGEARGSCARVFAQ